jgi:hypothetical protein
LSTETRNGHVAEFDERLLIGSTLDFHIAAVHQYPQPLEAVICIYILRVAIAAQR